MMKKSPHKSALSAGSDRSFHLVNITVLTLIFLIVLFPLLHVVAASFSSAHAVITSRVWLWPVEFTFDGYNACFKNQLLMTGYLNSLLYMVTGTAVNVLLLLLAAIPCLALICRASGCRASFRVHHVLPTQA